MDSKFKPNDAALLIDRKGRRYLKILRPGVKLLIRGELMADDIIGVEEGSRVKFSSGEMYLALRPTYADLIPHLPRAAQVIYPKDTGPLLIWGDVFPGATVIEGGTGAGALTIALLRAVGPNGRVISYEIREDFAKAATKNVATFFGDAPNWTLRLHDLYQGFEETGVDRLFLESSGARPRSHRRRESVARRRRAGLLCSHDGAAQGHLRGTPALAIIRRNRIIRDDAALLAGEGNERAPDASDDCAFRVHHRVAAALGYRRGTAALADRR